jgi:KaiC/GvpD/RAD55 family RecA-like ATPase
MIQSGIAPLDHQLGGVFPRRLHLLTGGPGTGKSTACLQFLQAGLRVGEPVALLTLDRLADLASHALSLGLELEAVLRSGRLVLMRFRPEFSRLLSNTASPDRLLDDLRRLITTNQSTRFVIDPLTPFLAEGGASAAAFAALTAFLDEAGVTTILTYPADVSAGYDARLEPVVRRAAAIVHLTRAGTSAHRMQIVQTRFRAAPAGAVRFVLTPGAGLVTEDGEPASELDVASTNGIGRVLKGELSQ